MERQGRSGQLSSTASRATEAHRALGHRSFMGGNTPAGGGARQAAGRYVSPGLTTGQADYLRDDQARPCPLGAGPAAKDLCFLFDALPARSRIRSEASAGQPDALKFHSACDCIIVPVGPGQALPAINQELQEEWREATRGQRDQIGAWNEYVAAKYPGAGLMSRTALKTTAKTRAAHH